jgi:UDP-3-O-[3-hydroxymyristoyl] N-acetylglucosamine deacetylase
VRNQRTLAGEVEVAGIALHGGGNVRALLQPAAVNTGVVFVSKGVSIPAQVAHVVDTQLATTLGQDGVHIRTVEHLLSTLYGLGIDNLTVLVDGDELPVLDGCGAEWIVRLRGAGVVDQALPVRRFFIKKPVEIRHGHRWARLEPSEQTELDVTIEFDHPHVGRQHLAMALVPDAFASELAWARTFGFEHLVPAMQRMGLVRGGSLENALVFGESGPLNEGGLRAPDEPVRHKMLDALGDLALLGHPVCGRLVTERPGHGVIFQLIQAVLADTRSWEIL